MPTGQHSELGAYVLAALGSTCIHDGPTRTRPHAQSETVLLGPPTIVRLKRALGHDSWAPSTTSDPIVGTFHKIVDEHHSDSLKLLKY